MDEQGFAFIVVIVVLLVGFFSYSAVKKKITYKSQISQRGNLQRKQTENLADENNLKVYKIFTLGTSGAGKTCFMASMFHRLSAYNPGIGFYLEVSDNRQRILLTNIYNKITDPFSEWPSGTINEEEWHFTSVVSADGNNYPVFKFTYLDYAGGQLTNPSEADLLDAQAKVAEADAILVLLDGQKILRRLENREHLIDDAEKRIGPELNFVLPYLTKSPGKPVHFLEL